MKKTILVLYFFVLIMGSGLVKAAEYAANPQAYLYKNFADELLLKGNKEKAVLAYQWAALLDPSYGNAHYNRAIALNEMGKLLEARNALDDYLRLCPKDPEALYNKGVLSIYLEDYKTAELCLSSALCHCKDTQFAYTVKKALAFLIRYEDTLSGYDKEGQKKLHKQLLAFASNKN